MQYKAEGIITRIYPIGEADKIAVIFTRELGKIRGIAKGSRKPKSKLAGRIDLFCQNEFLLGAGKNLYYITQAETINNFYAIRSDYEKIMTASYMANVINTVTLPEYRTEPLYDLVIESFNLLTSNNNYDRIKRSFQNRFLETEGLSGGKPVSSDREFERIIAENLT